MVGYFILLFDSKSMYCIGEKKTRASHFKNEHDIITRPYMGPAFKSRLFVVTHVFSCELTTARVLVFPNIKCLMKSRPFQGGIQVYLPDLRILYNIYIKILSRFLQNEKNVFLRGYCTSGPYF